MSSTKLRSMTGIGLGRAALANGTVSVELRAVNHRHLDVRVRVSPELAEDGAAIEEEARATCVRGRIEIHARWEAGEAEVAPFDLTRARSLYRSLLTLRDELAPGQEVPVAAVLSVPGLLSSTTALDASERTAAVRKATEAAARDLDAMRVREGGALARDFEVRLDLLASHTVWVEAQRPTVIEGMRSRMQKRMEKLLEGTEITLDPSRLLQEIAWFADKSDIAEEITRLTSHLSQFRKLLHEAGESTGKKLDFLVQEMGREVNTIGSKANDALIAHRVVEMKAELERIREQVQNVL